jgi:hypothetical protein
VAASNNLHLIEQHLSLWFQSLENPAGTQTRKMLELLEFYDETELGQRAHAGSVETYNKFKEFLPILTYESLSPYLNTLYSGEYKVLVSEEPKLMALSRGTRKFQKNIPVTARDLQARIAAWPRSLFSYVRKTGRIDILGGYCANLCLPSNVKLIMMGDSRLPAGYSTGIVSRGITDQFGIQIKPGQAELDALPPSLTGSALKKRFQLITKHLKGMPVTAVKGNADLILKYGKYLKSRFGKTPKQIWNISVLMCSGALSIHAKYKLALRELFGDCIILEHYEAAEGTFAQQIDEDPFLVPNYDLYFYELQTKAGIKPLYAAVPGEAGSLIISSTVLPRYKIGDTIKCMTHNKFVVIGREGSVGRLKMSSSKSSLATDKDIW